MWAGFAENGMLLWDLFNKCDTFGCRPSEMLGVTDVWMAYEVDSAVYTFGSALKGELESVEGKNKTEIKKKRERILRKWFDLPQKFRNPGMVGPGIEQQVTVKGEG
jgi:hypothetical protein